MKWTYLALGYNYDIKSSQLEILRHELVRIGVSPKNLKRLETSYIMKELEISEDYVRCFRFLTIFSAAFVSLSFKSVTGNTSTTGSCEGWQGVKTLEKANETTQGRSLAPY